MANRTCSVDGCDKPYEARDYCRRHYYKILKASTGPVDFYKPTLDLTLNEAGLERFAEIGWTVVASGCWEWNGKRAKGDYGMFGLRKSEGAPRVRSVGAHRIAYTMFVGPIPQGYAVLHDCDNPPCVNPTHLRADTQSQNIHDMYAKGRDTARTGILDDVRHLAIAATAKLDEVKVRDIRDRYAAGGVLQRDLADEYGVSLPLVNRVIKRKAWKNVA